MIPAGWVGGLFAFGSAVALALVTCLWWWRTVEPSARWIPWWVLPVAAAAAGLVESVHRTYWLGQVNLFLVAGLSVAVLVRSPVARGVLIGLAAAVKLTPGVFLVWLMVTRQFRAAAVACGTMAGTMLLGFVFLPSASWQYWTVSVWQPGRVGRRWVTSNQSLRGAVSRYVAVDAQQAVWLVVVAAVFVSCVVASAWLWRRGSYPQSFLVMVFVSLLCSPVSWLHHWVWLWPTTLLAGAVCLRYVTLTRGWVAGAVAGVVGFWSVSRSGWRVPDAVGIEVPQPWPHFLVTDTTVVLGLLAVAWLVWDGTRASSGSGVQSFVEAKSDFGSGWGATAGEGLGERHVPGSLASPTAVVDVSKQQDSASERSES